MSLHIQNEGTLVSRIILNLKDPNGVYSISCAENSKHLIPTDQEEEDNNKTNRISVVVPMGHSAEFRVEFTPSSSGRHVGELKLSVMDNPYEEGLIQLIGEGYEDDVTIDNIRSSGVGEEVGNTMEIADNAPGKCLGLGTIFQCRHLILFGKRLFLIG